METEREGAAGGGLEPGLLTAARMRAWRRGLGLPAPPALEAVLVTHQGALFRALAPRFRARRLRGLSAEIRALPGSGGRLAVACPGLGGPATAVLLEELAVIGVRKVVSIDVAGSLDPGCPSGAIVSAERAVIGDGTSPHYAPGAREVLPDADLCRHLLSVLRAARLEVFSGAVWSTDAPYRETAPEVEKWRNQGAVLVDMETAALFAAASALGIAAAAVLVVADELFDGWRAPTNLSAIQMRLRRVAFAVREVVKA